MLYGCVGPFAESPEWMGRTTKNGEWMKPRVLVESRPRASHAKAFLEPSSVIWHDQRPAPCPASCASCARVETSALWTCALAKGRRMLTGAQPRSLRTPECRRVSSSRAYASPTR